MKFSNIRNFQLTHFSVFLLIFILLQACSGGSDAPTEADNGLIFDPTWYTRECLSKHKRESWL